MAEVKLIQMTQNPIDVMWVGARTCYSEKSPIEMWDETRDEPKEEYKEEIENKRWNLVKKVLDSGHESIAENVIFTFAIEGVSRSLTHQLVRHRLAVYTQQSQRYVNFKDKVFNYVTPYTILKNEKVKEKYDKFMVACKELYDEFIEDNIPAEDARYILPNASCSNINMTVNLRELSHICSLRLCNRSQKEIRDLFNLIKKEVEKVEPRLVEYLVPKCERLGFCNESMCCGRKPKLKDILEKVYKYDTLEM